MKMVKRSLGLSGRNSEDQRWCCDLLIPGLDVYLLSLSQQNESFPVDSCADQDQMCAGLGFVKINRCSCIFTLHL